MKYQPDRYVVKIRERKDNYTGSPMWGLKDQPPLFDTYTEAWAWLHDHRLRMVEQAKKNLRGQERAYKRVMALKPHDLVEQPQNDEDNAPVT